MVLGRDFLVQTSLESVTSKHFLIKRERIKTEIIKRSEPIILEKGGGPYRFSAISRAKRCQLGELNTALYVK